MNKMECGCNDLLRKIRAVDFAIQETVLYLDAYPCDREALEYYHKLVGIGKELREQYESGCGPLRKTGNRSRTNWDWISSPWPWEPEANNK